MIAKYSGLNLRKCKILLRAFSIQQVLVKKNPKTSHKKITLDFIWQNYKTSEHNDSVMTNNIVYQGFISFIYFLFFKCKWFVK